ncbi:hypothetical protein [Caproiciproducens sp.]|uniref:hypothetical protein n=1 Tax=Caproiciproducens sp. TaxID=1954376 RepID=UPI00289B0C58|nr:hypothetical protein [Caproiciproducens sp.]
MKRHVEKYDFKAFGQAIKAARKAKGISVDQFFFPDKETDKSTQRRQLDDMSDKGLRIVTSTAKEIQKVETEDE